MSRFGSPQSPFFKLVTFLSRKEEQKLHDSKKRQKLRSSYINRFISDRRKINSKKGLCGDTRLDMPFRTKKKIKYIELACNEKNLPEDQKIMN